MKVMMMMMNLYVGLPQFPYVFFLIWQSSPHPLGTEEETIILGVITSIPESFSCFPPVILSISK